jgi:short-subunit dehydrogenase
MGTGIHVCTLNTGPVISRFRENATQKFLDAVDMDRSVHYDEYRSEVLKRQETKEEVNWMNRTPDAVVERLIHALESPRPKARYYITPPTYLLGTLKRLLSTRLLDQLLRKAQ